MSKFIQVLESRYKTCYINVEHIVSVVYENSSTNINLVNGQVINTNEPIVEIMEKINGQL